MKTKFWHSKWFVVILTIIVLLPALLLLALRIDFLTHEREREDAVLKYFSQQEGMPETFSYLEQITSPSSVILCWWDYGRAITEWSHREVIEAYPSRDIWHTVGSSRNPWHNLGAQLFGTWGSSEKIHDLARIFMLSEEEALPIIGSYNASYALVFTPDDLQKFRWIAEIAGYNATEYLTLQGDVYQPTLLGSQATLLRLLFDEILHPQHFTKVFDNEKGKIYRVDYP